MSRCRLRAPGCYEIRLASHLDERWAVSFAGLQLTLHDDGTTTLCGPVADQAELHGHLARVRDLGAPLLAVTALDEPHPARTDITDPDHQE